MAAPKGQRASLTLVNGAAVAAEVGFHQRRLLLALFGAASPGPAVHVGLDHQRLLSFLLLLLLQERPLRFTEHADSFSKGNLKAFFLAFEILSKICCE